MTLVMYDSVDLDQIPVDAPAVAGYVGGSWPTYTQLAHRFPHAHRLSIAVNASEDADCLDVENGDATPEQAPDWIKRQLQRGVWRPCIYSSRANMEKIHQLCAAAGIKRADVRLWIADWTFSPHIPSGYDACQWGDRALGRNLDESLCQDSFFPQPTKPATPTKPHRRRPARPHPKVIGATTGGALGVVLTAILHGAGIHIDAQLGAAISTLATALGGYLTPVAH